MVDKNRLNKKNKKKEVNLLSVFYFALIFFVVIYLFYALFGTSYTNSKEKDLSLFNIETVSDGHDIIMDFPEFRIKK